MKTAKEIKDIINSVRIPDVTNEVDRITEEFAKQSLSGRRRINVVVKLPNGVDLTCHMYVKYVDQVREMLHKLGFYTSCLKGEEWGPDYIIVSVDKLSWMEMNLSWW
jgi:predicted DNA-binding protein (UPF0278 family)